MSETRDFFVSYTKADESWALWITWVLEQNGHTVMIQALDFAPGRDFLDEMRRALRLSKQVIAVLSPDYFRSDYAAAELNAALAEDPRGTRGRLIPIRVQICDLDEMMRARIYIDLVGKDREKAGHSLLAGIAAAHLTQASALPRARFDKPPKFPGEVVAVTRPGLPIVEHDTQRVVLYLGVEAGAGLDLTGQAKHLKRIFRKSPNAERFRLEARLDADADNIFDILNRYGPHVVHFSGKQNGGNVVIRTGAGSVTTITDLALAGLLQNINDTVVMAIVDTCESLRCAKSVVGQVPFAIGVAGEIYDDDAIRFYNVFYDALLAGRSVHTATAQARASLEFRKVKSEQIPELLVRDGIDPKVFKFV